MRVINTCGLVDLIDKRGLDFAVGTNGEHLSGGQKQRIEIARAVLSGRDLLIADEITSSLDEQTAKEIKDTLLALPKTIVEMAHHNTGSYLDQYDTVINLDTI